jgi:hypothetical protein
MINQAKSQISYHRIEEPDLPRSIVLPTSSHHGNEKTERRTAIGRWFNLHEDSLVLWVRVLCILFCGIFWYGAFRFVKMFLL